MTFADLAAPCPAAAGLNALRPSLVYTSGSTGEPKAAVYPRRYVRGNWLQTVRWMGVQPGDRVWCTAGTGWAKSLRNAWFAPWLRGAETVLHEARFDPDERLRMIARLRPTVLCMSPTELRLREVRRVRARADLSSVREVVAAGEPLGADVLERYREQHGLRIRDGYGQTETGAVAGVMRDEDSAPGSLGRPLDGVDLRLDDHGEILVRAASVPTFFLGYLDDAGVQEPAALEDGWWRTGDRARRDEAGQLWFEGRADDVIISAGYRIGPVEVESALGSHPAVREAAAVARPDPARASSTPIVGAPTGSRASSGACDGAPAPLQARRVAHQVPALDRLRALAADGPARARSCARSCARSSRGCRKLPVMAAWTGALRAMYDAPGAV